ncbi:hypothetical protein P153DRAFT_328659 [Dothidotthia symphoricarpi CBS 119687]|uniref:CBF1-interacting co-repressor CIR N-terminal domain-containing protein n=1 Tax=Dothidotthia symphoricarpi CBS 119687 TaxID=1392245 RepID=A0A6A6AS69_9PLEO|nr:uncharacterized protein P153DRAFT_328659 [Dothidotthia symphoricarpi CBS 119687]KAF2134406.1 hypothetical protein P153DRAFT_328659 [Dothidotthia symphoricarpi CBS 119687]
MPLHLLGKKSWNVYNPANIARVKADEDAAAAREAADEQRMQDLDAERRAAILRGLTPPPLPEADPEKDAERERENGKRDRGHDKKRRKLAGEDDTDMDIRLAASITAPKGVDDDDGTKVLKLRTSASDAPLTDHAGNINLFPVDVKEAMKREKNAELEREKQKKRKALEDQYTMRFSNAAGRGGTTQPWYSLSAHKEPSQDARPSENLAALESKNVWGDEDPLRKTREQARISSNDPFAFMQKAQSQLKKSKEDKKRWAAERKRELMELRNEQERDDRSRQHKRRRKQDDGAEVSSHHSDRHGDKDVLSRHRSRRRSRSRSRERKHDLDAGRRRERRRSRSRSRDRDRGSNHRHTLHSKDRDTRDDRARHRETGPLQRET